jgi:hypothetical protein
MSISCEAESMREDCRIATLGRVIMRRAAGRRESRR